MTRSIVTPLLMILFVSVAAIALPPNVVLILTDDQGFGDMSCHGNPYVKTPNIDRLYRESVRLTDFHVDPTCSPTRAALMTGRYSSRVGVWLDPRKHDVSQKLYGLPSGVIRATQARLKVGDFDETVSVDAGQRSVVFQIAMPAGPVHLQTWLTDATGKAWGAYFVYEERL